MNCQDFDNLTGDLARGVPTEARAREEARAHEADCPRCAARLADERALSEGLRGLAASVSAAAAPPRVEANLLAAFRAQAPRHEAAADEAGEAAGEAKPDEKVLPFARPAEAPRRWTWARTAAASAAAAAAAVALFVLVAPRPNSPTQSAQAGGAEPPRRALTPPPAPASGDPGTSPVTSSMPSPVASPAEVAQLDGVDVDDAPAPRAPEAPRLRPPGRMTTPVAYHGRASRPAQSARPGRTGEIATSFIPLTEDAALAAAEGGQVVRVELSHTALQRFGLPFNVERAGERVKADVLLGHDGVARAIRFVR